MARPRAVQDVTGREVVHVNGLSASPGGVKIDVAALFSGRLADVIVVQNVGKKDVKVHLAAGGVSGGYAIVRPKEDMEFRVALAEFWISGPNEPFEVTLTRRG